MDPPNRSGTNLPAISQSSWHKSTTAHNELVIIPNRQHTPKKNRSTTQLLYNSSSSHNHSLRRRYARKLIAITSACKPTKAACRNLFALAVGTSTNHRKFLQHTTHRVASHRLLREHFGRNNHPKQVGSIVQHLCRNI